MPSQSNSDSQSDVFEPHGSGKSLPVPTSASQLSTTGPHMPEPFETWHVVDSPSQPEQSAFVMHAPLPSLPQGVAHVPLGVQVLPSGHGKVGEHSAHLWALQAWASLPAEPHIEHSASVVQTLGQLGEQTPLSHVLLVGHSLVFSGVQPTQTPPWARSQMRCCGSHAEQSRSVAHAMVGWP
ncbi:MAG: hypothetical protein L6Q76_38555 [Polyangiaceae bacterium]|nr:hypothetical protein [Polyangiaceae bacterium]